MNNLIILLLSFIAISCATQPKYEAVYSDQEIQPYVDNWKVNNELSSTFLKDQKREIPVNFSNSQPSLVGFCRLHEDLNKRKVYINPKSWKMYPEQRARWVNNLLSMCYGYRRGGEVFYDLPYNGS